MPHHQEEIFSILAAKAALERLENSLFRILKRTFPAESSLQGQTLPATQWMFKKYLLNKYTNGQNEQIG